MELNFLRELVSPLLKTETEVGRYQSHPTEQLMVLDTKTGTVYVVGQELNRIEPKQRRYRE